MNLAPPTMEQSNPGIGWIRILMLLTSLFVVAWLIVPSLGKSGRGPIDGTKVAISSFEVALTMYAIDHNGSFPVASSEGVAQLLMTPGQDKNGKFSMAYIEQVPKDIWGQPLHYEWPNKRNQKSKRPAIWSSGWNKQNEDGAGDDINNWSEAAN